MKSNSFICCLMTLICSASAIVILSEIAYITSQKYIRFYSSNTTNILPHLISCAVSCTLYEHCKGFLIQTDPTCFFVTSAQDPDRYSASVWNYYKDVNYGSDRSSTINHGSAKSTESNLDVMTTKANLDHFTTESNVDLISTDSYLPQNSATTSTTSPLASTFCIASLHKGPTSPNVWVRYDGTDNIKWFNINNNNNIYDISSEYAEPHLKQFYYPEVRVGVTDMYFYTKLFVIYGNKIELHDYTAKGFKPVIDSEKAVKIEYGSEAPSHVDAAEYYNYLYLVSDMTVYQYKVIGQGVPFTYTLLKIVDPNTNTLFNPFVGHLITALLISDRNIIAQTENKLFVYDRAARQMVQNYSFYQCQ